MDDQSSKKVPDGKPQGQSVCFDSKERTREFEDKRKAIIDACHSRDIKALVSHATSSGGLLTDTLRQAACMFLCTFGTEGLLIVLDAFQGLSYSVLMLRKKSPFKIGRIGKI